MHAIRDTRDTLGHNYARAETHACGFAGAKSKDLFFFRAFSESFERIYASDMPGFSFLITTLPCALFLFHVFARYLESGALDFSLFSFPPPLFAV